MQTFASTLGRSTKSARSTGKVTTNLPIEPSKSKIMENMMKLWRMYSSTSGAGVPCACMV
ncbi:hypothetical protein Hanom_Chr15g01351661 [Helianthus anomalus]